MNNPFFLVTSNGGYLGAFVWCNSRTRRDDLGLGFGWGAVAFFGNSDLNWPGASSIIRMLVR